MPCFARGCSRTALRSLVLFLASWSVLAQIATQQCTIAVANFSLMSPAPQCEPFISAALTDASSSAACITSSTASVNCFNPRTLMSLPYNGIMAPPPLLPPSICPLCNVTNASAAGSGACIAILKAALAAVTANGAASTSSGAAAVAASCSNAPDTALLTALVHQGSLTCSRSTSLGADTIFINASSPLYGGLVPQNQVFVVGALDMRSLTQCGTCGFTPCTSSPGQAMYCPANTPASICPGGSYCPDPTRRIVCPFGSFCPPGSSQPLSCRPVAAGSCLEGSAREIVWVPLLIAVLLLGCLAYGKRAAASPSGPAWLTQAIGLPGPLLLGAASGTIRESGGRGAAALGETGGAGGSSTSSTGSTGGLRIAYRDLKLVSGTTVRLDGVSGAIRPGKFTAIIGGSGAGKTSLMNVLLAREAATSGSVAFYPTTDSSSAAASEKGRDAVTVTAESPSSSSSLPPAVAGTAPLSASALRRVVGFVPQVDVMRRDMTVEQVLTHSARLRLPLGTTSAEAAARVDAAISVLGLQRIRYTVIGGDSGSSSGGDRHGGGCCSSLWHTRCFASLKSCLCCSRGAASSSQARAAVATGSHSDGKSSSAISSTKSSGSASGGSSSAGGISPGDRKLVNVGMELVAQPRLLCLDEPTSGVDASTAMRLAHTIGSLCRSSGMTALAVLHQPRGEIYSLLDDIIVLVPGGRVAYAGSAADAVGYFASLGYACPPKANKTDFLLDVVSGALLRVTGSTGTGTQAATGTSTGTQATTLSAGRGSGVPASGPLLPQQFADAWDHHVAAVAARALAAASPSESESRPAPVSSSSASSSHWHDDVPPQAGFFRQVCLYAYREALVRAKGAALVDMCSHLLGGIIIGIVTCAGPLLSLPLPLQYKLACPPGGEELCVRWLRQMAEPATFYWTMTLVAVSIPPAVRAFGSEKPVFYREAFAGARPLAYYVGKVCASIPYFALAAFMFLAPMQAIAPWRGPVPSMYLICLALALFAQALGTALALLFSDPDAATLVGVIIAILANLFGGFVPMIGNGAVWAYTRWSARAILAAELDQGEGLGPLFDPVVSSEHRSPNFGADIGILALFILGTHACGYALLRLAVRRNVTGIGKRRLCFACTCRC